MPKSEEELEAERPAEDAPESDWKRFARDWEARAKAKPKVSDEELQALREKAQKFDETEQANMSKLEQAEARATAAEQKLADREAKDSAAATAAEIAKEKGVPVEALRGSTREELEAHADALAAILPKPPAAPSADGQGDDGAPISEGDMSAEDVVAAATGR